MKQIKNTFGILGESHGQDRKHKEEITIFKNSAENQQRNQENNILEVLGQALRKQKKPAENQKKIIFQNSFLSHSKFQDLQKKKKQKNQKNNISELFLESPQIPRPGKNQKKPKEPKKPIFQNSFWRHPKFQDLEKTKKTKRTKKTNISELFLETPQIPRPLENCFFCFFLFFWFSAGFCQEA